MEDTLEGAPPPIRKRKKRNGSKALTRSLQLDPASAAFYEQTRRRYRLQDPQQQMNAEEPEPDPIGLLYDAGLEMSDILRSKHPHMRIDI